MFRRFWHWIQPPLHGVPQYGLRYFEHLLGLYEATASQVSDPNDRDKLNAIETWEGMRWGGKTSTPSTSSS